DPLGRAVGHLRPLARLGIEAVEIARQVDHTLDVEADHPGEPARGAGEALEADVDARLRPRRVLLDDVRQHAVARGQLETPHHPFEQRLEPRDRVEVVGGWIEPENDVAAAVGDAVEDREQDFAFVVARAVRLDACAEMPRMPDADSRTAERVEQRTRQRRQLVVAHDLHDRADRLARERVAVLRHPLGSARARQRLFQAGDRHRVQLGVGAAVAGAIERCGHPIVDRRSAPDIAHRRGQQRLARVLAQPVVRGAADGEVALLERTGKREGSAQFLTGHGPRPLWHPWCRSIILSLRMSSLATLFEPPDDATAEDLRGRLRAMADLVARAPVPIAVAHDADCRFISANDALGRLLGVPPEVNISMTPRAGEHPLYRIQHNGRDLPPNELPMQYAIAHRTHVTNDIEIVRADASVVYVQNDVEPLYDRRGQVCGCVSVCVDLTDRRRVEMVLREADRRKDEFLATLSHELRNPLAPIRNAVELMRRAGHDPHIAERALAIMERQLHQLVRLTDDLLDVSRITRDTIELRRDRIDLRAVLRSALETIDPLSHAAGHDLTVDLPQTALWVYADFTRLAQAFVNLLNNAVKYTDRGGHISLDVLVEGGGAVVSLRDTGFGIEPALLPRIF